MFVGQENQQDPAHDGIPQTTVIEDKNANANEMTQYTFEQYRIKLIDAILNDHILTGTICESIVHSYSTDLIQTFCSTVEKNFDDDLSHCQQAIEFVSRWLLLIDDNDHQSLDSYSNKHAWFLSHAYTSFEYEQNDIVSMYSAFRTINRIGSSSLSYNNLFGDESITRSNFREKFFYLIFNYLWENLNQLCKSNENCEKWIYTYTFISKYYPSEKVLRGLELAEIKSQIEFMGLAYLILLNDSINESHRLISILLTEIKINESSVCLRLIPTITNIINEYLKNNNIVNSTLFIDLQHWIITLVKSIKQPSKQDIFFLFKYIDVSACPLSIAMKQILLDEAINVFLCIEDRSKQYFDIWDRFKMIPYLLECVSSFDFINDYRIPFHPSILSDNNDLQKRQVLFDLYFFHLRHQMTNESITTTLINKGMLLRLQNIQNQQLKSIGENIFTQLKDYFRVTMIGLLLCEINLNATEQNNANDILSTIIQEFLSIDDQATEFNHYLHIFLSTIILKKSWNFLLNLLKSENIQHLNNEWATKLYCLLELKETKNETKHLQLCHQIQFTLSSKNDSSIFPELHEPYQELRKIIDTCVKNNTEVNCWEHLSEWVQSKMNTDPVNLQLKEIKAMVLLIIYYEYYCTNRLSSIHSLLELIENSLELTIEELKLFRVLIRPVEFMVGYPRDNNHDDKNFLNDIFKLDCDDEFELCIRHLLVNLMAMIYLGGENSFLWTFMFQPSKLQDTFG